MKRRPRLAGGEGLPAGYLVASLALAIAGLALTLATTEARPYELRATALAAAERMARANEVLRAAMGERGIGLEAREDPNGTFFIGPEWTELTTTLGDLEAKRTTTNPNFAAAMVRYLDAAGCEPGDVVAIGASGSFPALLVATLCAAEEMGLRPLVIASYGSSMYGATRPLFPISAFVRALEQAGVIQASLLAVSPGGDLDAGGNSLFDEAGTLIDRLASESGARYIRIQPPSIAESVKERLSAYEEAAGAAGIACFVNIGGASPNSGTSSYTLDFPQGLVLDPPRIPSSPERGLVYEFAARGVPVVNLLNIRRLAAELGLPFDPVPLPKPGEGDVYLERAVNAAAAIAALLCAMTPLVLGLRRRLAKR